MTSDTTRILLKNLFFLVATYLTGCALLLNYLSACAYFDSTCSMTENLSHIMRHILYSITMIVTFLSIYLMSFRIQAKGVWSPDDLYFINWIAIIALFLSAIAQVTGLTDSIPTISASLVVMQFYFILLTMAYWSTLLCKTGIESIRFIVGKPPLNEN